MSTLNSFKLQDAAEFDCVTWKKIYERLLINFNKKYKQNSEFRSLQIFTF